MPNMSYCRFRNTVLDMQDCLYAIQEEKINDLSKEELRALQEFLDLAWEITNYEEQIEEAISMSF